MRRRRELGHRVGQCHIGSGDRGRACAAVGLQHVAVECHGALAQRAHVDDGPQRASDQALDLERASALLAPGRFARAARVGRARQHAVLGRNPALAFAAQEGRHAILHGRGHEYACVAEFDEHGALGVTRETARNADRSQVTGRAATMSQVASPAAIRSSCRAGGSGIRRRASGLPPPMYCRHKGRCSPRHARRGRPRLCAGRSGRPARTQPSVRP